MGSSTYADRNWNPFTKMDRKKSGITDAMMENAIRNYKEKYLSGFPKYSNNKEKESSFSKHSDQSNPKKKHSTPHTDSDRNSFTYVNSDPNNSENNPFTNVNPDYNKSKNKYSTTADSYSNSNNSKNNENSSNLNKNSGYFVYVESPLFWDEVTYTWRKRGETITNPNNYSYLP